jgi:hypothetical protein
MFRRLVLASALRRTLLALGAIVLTAGAAKAADYVLSGRVPAHTHVTRSLWVGPTDNWVIVIGDGSSDLDCSLWNPDGQLVGTDDNVTDICILPAPNVGTHTLDIRNLGDVYNDYTVYTTEHLPR